MVSLTKTVATEWGHAGVRLSALSPDWTATDLNRGLCDTPARAPSAASFSSHRPLLLTLRTR